MPNLTNEGFERIHARIFPACFKPSLVALNQALQLLVIHLWGLCGQHTVYLLTDTHTCAHTHTHTHSTAQT